MKLVLTLSLSLLSLTASAAAQRQVLPEDLRGLSQTDRETIHPGDPLEVIGIDQGDNNFRAVSPALAEGELAVTMVDPEELRARRLAMYSSQARYSTPPASSARRTGASLTRGLPDFVADRAVREVEDHSGDDEGSNLPYWLGGVALIGALVVLRQRS